MLTPQQHAEFERLKTDIAALDESDPDIAEIKRFIGVTEQTLTFAGSLLKSDETQKLRLQAALAVLQGLCSSSPRLTDHPETLASRAFSVADAFLAEAQKEGKV